MLEAIVLAGGFGTRLRSMVPDLPKPMAPVAGRPFLEILLNNLAHKGIHKVVLSLGYKADTITGHFGETYAGMQLTYTLEDEPLGTGGAVRLAMTESSADHVYVFNGDSFVDLELDAVENLWRANHHPIIVGIETPDTSRYGRLLTERGRLAGFAEKGIGGAGLINAGCYVLNRGQLDAYPPGKAFSLEADYFATAIRKEPFDVFVTAGHFIDIGVPEDYARAQIELAGR